MSIIDQPTRIGEWHACHSTASLVRQGHAIQNRAVRAEQSAPGHATGQGSRLEILGRQHRGLLQSRCHQWAIFLLAVNH